ncbi:unnamed protein product [Protopolystoma xenopodis]|uniref:Uncharacterized protein n=1 Tax=Protopolystoma xenopodis TaxID=117903 RepID=A0A3S5BI02_9PLAT|nr:unnamed protein product [Protopolystoma xenopodis]
MDPRLNTKYGGENRGREKIRARHHVLRISVDVDDARQKLSRPGVTQSFEDLRAIDNSDAFGEGKNWPYKIHKGAELGPPVDGDSETVGNLYKLLVPSQVNRTFNNIKSPSKSAKMNLGVSGFCCYLWAPFIMLLQVMTLGLPDRLWRLGYQWLNIPVLLTFPVATLDPPY